METVNPLDKLSLLEKKVSQLIEVLKAEKALCAKLLEEKNELSARITAMENSLLKESKSLDELNQERALTKMMVDDLISSIDRLVDGLPGSKA